MFVTTLNGSEYAEIKLHLKMKIFCVHTQKHSNSVGHWMDINIFTYTHTNS